MDRANRVVEYRGSRRLIAAALAPDAAERAVLKARLGALEGALAPAPAAEIDRLVSWLFTLSVPRDEDEGDLEKLIEGYVAVLRGSALWALDAACVKHARASKFRPVPAELVALVTAETHALLKEWFSIAEVLSAEIEKPPPTAEERARVAAGFRQLLKAWPPEPPGAANAREAAEENPGHEAVEARPGIAGEWNSLGTAAQSASGEFPPSKAAP